MKIFDSKKNNDNFDSNIHTLIGSLSEFNGILSFSGSIRIDGKFIGEIKSEDFLIVGDSALIEANIFIGTIIINGKITGDIIARNSVELSDLAIVNGNITTPILIIKKGAIINGMCNMKIS